MHAHTRTHVATETHMHSNTQHRDTQHSSAHTHRTYTLAYTRACTHTCTGRCFVPGLLVSDVGTMCVITSHFTECSLEPRPLCPSRSLLLQTRRVTKERPSGPLLTASRVCQLSPECPRWQSRAHLPSCHIPFLSALRAFAAVPQGLRGSPLVHGGPWVPVTQTWRWGRGHPGASRQGPRCSLVLSLAGSPGSSMGK